MSQTSYKYDLKFWEIEHGIDNVVKPVDAKRRKHGQTKDKKRTVAPGYTSIFFTNTILNDIHLFVYGCTSIERNYFVAYYVNNGLLCK